MSPTVPPIFVLSLLLLLPLPTMAGELMDLFTLIRRTLKYWRRIYQMYEEEVALGYCWAEYFLYQEGDMRNDSMSNPTPMNSSNCISNEIDNFRKPIPIDTYDPDAWNHWITQLNDRRQGYRRNKRSYKVLNSKDKKRNSTSRSNELILNFGSDENDNLMDNMLTNLILSLKSNKKRILKASEQIAIKTVEWNDYTKKFVAFDMDKGIDPVKVWYKRFSKNEQEDCMCYPGVSNFINTSIKDITEIPGNYFVRGSTTSNLLTKTDKLNFKSNVLNSNFKFKDIDPVTDRTKEARENYSILGPKYRESNGQKISNAWNTILLRRNKKELSMQKSFYNNSQSRFVTRKLAFLQRLSPAFDSRSIKCDCRIDPQFSTFNRALYFARSLTPSERSVNQHDNSSPKKNISVIEKEFKGSRVEGEHGGKSENLQVDTRRKLLYSRANSVTSGTPSTVEFQPSRSFSLDRTVSLNSRFKDGRTNKKLTDNRKSGNFQNRRKFRSSNNGFQGVEQREKRSFPWNYRRNLRRKRDANDRIRTDAVRPHSKNEEASSNNLTSLNKIPRFSSKHVHLYESRSKSDQETFGRSVKHLCTAKIYVLHKIPIYDSEETHHETIPALRGIRRLPSNFADINSQSLNTSSDHVLVKRPSEDKDLEEHEDDGDKRGNSKQLLATKDNRYRRIKHELLVEKLVRTPSKTIPYPVGQPSLLPVIYSRFMADYGRTVQNSRPSRSSDTEDQGQRSPTMGIEARGLSRADGTLFHLRQTLLSFLRTLGFVMSVGRQLIDYVDSNTALACTKDYLVGKAMHWIDS